MSISAHLAERLRRLREQRGWSLETLAERSQVGRSTISQIERGESSPTATVLDKLATALGVTVAALFERPDGRPAGTPASPLALRAHQPVWTDPASGYVRRNLSPPVTGAPLQLVEVSFPPGQRVQFETAAREVQVHQQVWLMAGRMDITLGGQTWHLAAGDCLAMRLDAPTAFFNPGPEPARYVVALLSSAGPTLWSA